MEFEFWTKWFCVLILFIWLEYTIGSFVGRLLNKLGGDL